jgi:hypothetical protein
MITKNSFKQLLLNDWLIAPVAVVTVATILFIFPIRSLWSIASKADAVRQGKMIVDDIKAHDKTINAWCKNSGPAAEIRVYAVTDADRQNAIIRWIEDFKAHGQVNRPVKLRFYERENMIYMPGNRPGFGGWRRGAEKVVRTVTL